MCKSLATGMTPVAENVAGKNQKQLQPIDLADGQL
jgi:hypothetical protein